MLKTIPICDSCSANLNGNIGISIKGNIYVSGTNGGLVGGNIPDGVIFDQVRTQDFCASCFLKAMTPEFKEQLRLSLTIPILR